MTVKISTFYNKVFDLNNQNITVWCYQNAMKMLRNILHKKYWVAVPANGLVTWQSNMAGQSSAKVRTNDNSSKYIVYSCLFIGYSVFFYNRRSYTSLIPTLLRSVQLEESELGLISSCFALSYGLSKFVTGILSDKIPPRELFVAGLIGTGLCNAIFTTCRRVEMLALVWFLNGLFQGLSFPPCSKILEELFRPDEVRYKWGGCVCGVGGGG